MKEFILRTEDLTLEEVMDNFVETPIDRENINFLKGISPCLLVGSRGTGKTMLLKVTEKELTDEFDKTRVMPVFVSFSSAILVSSDSINFRRWMLSKILFAIQRKLRNKSLMIPRQPFAQYITEQGCQNIGDKLEKDLSDLIGLLEKSWRNVYDECTNDLQGINIINDLDYFKGLLEDICLNLNIKRFVLLFDEACHNFIPNQQREFFSLFRDLRCPYINCKAAVYPGITSYGTFESFHDAIVKRVERDIKSEGYAEKMREIVKKQLDPQIYQKLISNGENLDALIYSASGNPRLLLKSIYLASNELTGLKLKDVNTMFKEFYRTQIWYEHTKLSEKYKGHKSLIDWGRWFIEEKVLPETGNKNMRSETEEDYDKQTIFFIVHIDAPEAVKRAISILEYSGIVTLHTEGYKIRTNIYNRYQLNLGIVVAFDKTDNYIPYTKKIVDKLSVKVVTEYGVKSPAYASIETFTDVINDIDISKVAEELLNCSIDILDIYDYQKKELKSIGYNNLNDILGATQVDLQKAYLIGPKRSKNILKIATNAVLEYVSG